MLNKWETNSRRDTCGDLMASLSSKEPLISSSGPGVAQCDAARPSLLSYNGPIYHRAPASVSYSVVITAATDEEEDGHFGSEIQICLI